MSKNPQLDQIREMKQSLQEHYDRFKVLRESGKNEAALRQFNVTLKVAGDLMSLSTQILKGIAGTRPDAAAVEAEDRLEAGDLAQGKLYHFPKVSQTH